MTETRKQEIITDLQAIYDNFEPTLEEPEMSMFKLISTYNQTGKNTELIGGAWVREYAPEPLKSLP